MKMQNPVYVIIATAFNRYDWLLKRSLPSVYSQIGVSPQSIKVIIVDDNDGADSLNVIQTGVQELRQNMGLADDDFPTVIIKNSRTKNMSGTGAWNTGIYLAHQESPHCFVSILDDDDEYLNHHLSDCIRAADENTIAVFQRLCWLNQDRSRMELLFTAADLKPENFYTGNPGIQGSNMFFKAEHLVAIEGFDERFPNTTDRDLMIRFLQHHEKTAPHLRIQVIESLGVLHYNHNQQKVNNQLARKHQGLDLFYQKYKSSFTEGEYHKSLNRAELLFGYPGYNPKSESIALLMAMKNNGDTVGSAIQSILEQKGIQRRLQIIVSDDDSSDRSFEIVHDLAKKYGCIKVFRNKFGTAAGNRNWLQHYVKEHLSDCVLMGRLDADDTLSENSILRKIEASWEQEPFDVLLMSNNQILDGQPTGYINRPSEEFKDPRYLINRLQQMSNGLWEAELPSCNVFINPQVAIPYAETDSAEDHRNLLDYLIKSDDITISVRPEWIYCDYRIDKHKSNSEGEKNKRLKARKELYKYGLTKLSDKLRIDHARQLLQEWKPGLYKYLGAGFSGVVFHDHQWVYKVHLPLSTNNFNEVDNILFLKEKLDLFAGRKHFYALKELARIQDTYVLVYPFEVSDPVDTLDRNDMVSFLAEMWQMKVICRSITKENNFRRVHGIIKLIDYEIEPYNDNLFLNVAARAFIQLKEFEHPKKSYVKLKRSTINNFNLPELEGFYAFVEEVFEACATLSLGKVMTRLQSLTSKNQILDSEPKTVYDGKENPDVSLLIKACVQDSATLYNDVSLLVGQLTSHVKFARHVLLLDLYKTSDFLRQYTSAGNREELLAAADKLKNDGIITDVIIAPENAEEISSINNAWFGIRGKHTHSQKGVPVTSQLYAFEQVLGEFILQMDVDVLIGHQKQGDYLKSMIEALKSNDNAVSIGFQIYHHHSVGIQPIAGQDGSIPPDVRCCLLHKERLLNARPIENSCTEHGWDLSWYRALEKHQKVKGICALRGGNTNSYYIHIQNYRKTNRWVWYTIQQGVKKGLIPEKQAGHAEVTGSVFDWCLPRRAEELVVLLYLDRDDKSSFLKTLQILAAQDLEDFGLVIINNTGNPIFTEADGHELKPFKNRVTTIHFEHPVPSNEAIYKALHYYLPNPETFVCLMHQGDILLYPAVLSECMNRLKTYGADVLIGKEISKRVYADAGMSRSNFLHPRQEPQYVSNGLALFRKYLFDALSHLDLKSRNERISPHQPGYNKITKTYQWIHDRSFVSILVPIVELSQNPIRFDHINVLRIHTVEQEEVTNIEDWIRAKSPKKEGAWEKGRKTFLPNTHKIELDITYDCNLKCFHCNRSCTQAPTNSHMTLQQIQQFIQESVAINKSWELINVLGGEPTLHPQFEEIVQALLYTYVIPYSPKTTLQITSNGHGAQVQDKLNKLPKHPNLVINSNSFKDDRTVPYFTPFNLAPVDEPDADKHEYHKGCWVTSYCGIGLNHLGYFACGVAGGIERILKAGQGIPTLEALNEQLLQQQLNTYCRLCGNFTAYAENRGDFMERAEKDSAPKTAMSESWKQLYQKHNGK